MKPDLEQMLLQDPYSMEKAEKEAMLSEKLIALTRHHDTNCKQYHAIVKYLNMDIENLRSYYDILPVPVRLFKEFELLSVPPDTIRKVMTSSGTGGSVSKIFLDSDNIRAQSAVLAGLIASFIGKTRLPMIILDTKSVKKDRKMYAARGAGITGFSIYGRDIFYALNENMELDQAGMQAYMTKHQDETILMFGYTFMIWKYVLCEMKKQAVRMPLNRAILFHTGGWKKLEAQAVDADAFRAQVREAFGNVSIHNQYGMAEQLGSIFMECEYGHFHCSNYSDIIIRRAEDFSIQPTGQKGLAELVSILPSSYPGHVLLTEDEGLILGEDDCPCGRKGKYFKITGRVRQAEIRGCSDTYEG